MVQRYNPDYVMHAARFAPFARENEHGEYVKFSDYEALVSELASSRQINAQTLQVKLTMAEAIKELNARVNALAVENAAMKESRQRLAEFIHEELDADYPLNLEGETPATDAALAAIRTESHIAGVEAAANRIGVISLKYNPGQKHELIKAIGREVIKYATELREAK
ncbi:hypothetical protein BVG94_02525 [Serratia marcescens]|uniref:hypothetical protein n=1 Tax=Serratia marcescens TaxID=615 RepID=UPI000B614C52|nr:hypothetical protein [Serratia marcescens]ASL91590.1 hypothetical protein BVG94_02525 [Serratia marcescens]